MTTLFDWAVAKLEKGEEVHTLFNAKTLDMIRLYLEAHYQNWPTEIRIQNSMMTLTPTEPFKKREL